MNAHGFFETPEVLHVLDRASKSAGAPLSVHAVENNKEGPQVAGWGGCAACRYVSDVPRGRWACRASRRGAATMALSQQRPLTFICHMGFACVTAPALPDEPYLLTFGPFMPAAAAQSLEYDVRNGLADLEAAPEPGEALPFTLEDVHHAPADALPAVAEWTAEALRPLWDQWCAEQEPQGAPAGVATDDRPQAQAARTEQVILDPRHAEDIAAALAGGNQPQARALIQTLLADYKDNRKASTDTLRAFVIRLVSTVLEAAERAGLGAPAAWEAYPAFIAAVRIARRDADLLDATMLVLGILKRRSVRKSPGYAKLNELLNEHLGAKVTLEEAAAALGLSPSALSHRLRRKFNMNFSEYVGRLRVDKAKDMLRRTKLSATEIARRVGVADQSHFSKLFKKFEGLAPSEYRKRHGRSS